MIYRGYLKNLARAIEYRFNQISTHYNFDNGGEFEIAICHLLRDILPQKYGICRGFVVGLDDNAAGDDIIIYDKVRFPTLRLFSQETYDVKQDIPVEAVYAYIEAKHTLHIDGDPSDGQSVLKSCSQVASVKRIKREGRMPEYIHPYFKSTVSYGKRDDWPEYLNPIFGAIFARQVEQNKKGGILSANQTKKALIGACLGNQKPPPDLIVAGESNLIAPCVKTPEGIKVHAPFYIEGVTTSIEVIPAKNFAFSIGICFMLYALDTIELGRMPWENIINDGFMRSTF